MKYLVLISLIFGATSCSNSDKGFDVDSIESIERLKVDLRLEDFDITNEIHYWLGLDSSSVAYFKTDSCTFYRVVERLQMEPDSMKNDIWIPEDSPAWFGPSIKTSERSKTTWTKSLVNNRIFIQFNRKTKECFFANLKWHIN